MTNLEGRVLLRRRAVAPPPGVGTDTEILHGLAARLGSKAAFDVEPRDVFEELRRASAGGVADYAGISYDRIEAEEGVFWPCPTTEHAGTPRLFLETFATPDGRANFHPVRFHGAAEQPDGEFPYMLTTGRVLAHYQTGAQTRRVPALCAAEPDPFVEIHPDTARGLRIADGDTVRLTTRRGVAFVRARLSRDIRMDVLFAPFHWGGRATINRLTNPALDPISKIPEFKACAVRAERVEPAHARSTAVLQTERAEVA